MKDKITVMITLVVFLLCLGTLSATAQDISKLKYPKLNEVQIPDIEKVTLDNGLRLYLVEDRSLPLFNVSVRVNAGDYLEPAEKAGLVSIMGTVLRTGGTEKWTGDELDEKLEAIGAGVGASGNLSTCTANLNILSEYTDFGLEVLSQILRYPVFDEEKINLDKVQERSGIARRNDDPFGICIREFRKAVYGAESVYARHTEYATIDAITRDDLIAFHGTYFKPENTQMAIWGDFDKTEVIAMIEKYFGDWERGTITVPPLPEVEHTYRSKVFYAEKAGTEQSYILMGHIGGLTTDEDYPDRIVMNNILGAGGFGSRIFNTVRSKEGLAYSVQASYTSNFSFPGFFFAYASTKPESTVKATRLMQQVIAGMQTDPPTDFELSKGKDGWLNSFVFNFDTKSEVVNRLMSYDFYGISEDFLQRTKARIENITSDDVVAAANRRLHPDEMCILVVGNGEDFDEPLEALGLGPVDTLDISIPSAEEKRELVITPENLEKGKQILNQGVVAHGGLDNFKKIKSFYRKGTLTLVMQGQEIPLSIEVTQVLPSQNRINISFMGQMIYDIRDNDQGWKTDQMSGTVVPKTEEDLLNDKEDASRELISLFMNSDSPDCRAVFDGDGEIGGVFVEWIAILDEADESICRLAFDTSTHELVTKSYWGETMAGEGNIEETYSLWREIDGVRLPMTITRHMGGQKIGSRAFSQYDLNVEVAAGTFSKPE